MNDFLLGVYILGIPCTAYLVWMPMFLSRRNQSVLFWVLDLITIVLWPLVVPAWFLVSYMDRFKEKPNFDD